VTSPESAFPGASSARIVVTMTDTTHTALPLAPGRWELDPSHSEVSFTIRHLGISKVRGRFVDFEAELLVGEELGTSSVAATIQMGSLDTGNADRDAHVLSSELLDVAQRPTLEFRSTRIVTSDDRWVLEGLVTLGDATRPVTLDVEIGGIETFPIDGRRHAGFEATGELSRHDLGVHFGALDAGLGDKIRFQIDLQLVEPT
jgi:polyisoprenoid-binding protein YceI